MRFANLTSTYTGDIPPRSTSIVYCGVSIFRDACYQLVSAFLITYITYAGVLTTGDQGTYIAQIMTINAFIIACRIWDGVNDPIMGIIIEKVRFKWGKFKPWILFGGLGNTVVVLVLFLARPSGWGFVALFCVFYFLWDFVWTMNDIAYWSMLPSLTSDEKRRNTLTTAMQICISVGVFAVYGAVPLLIGRFEGVPSSTIYGIIAIIITALFLISQLALILVCKERLRSIEQEKKEKNDVRFKDMFKLFKQNDQFKWIIIAIFLNYLGAGVVVAFAMYYFYLMYGYGNSGGDIQFLFTVMYAVGTLLAQFLMPLFNKVMNRKKLLIMSCILIAIGYIAFFFLGFPLFGSRPIADGNLIFLLYIVGVVIFFAQGVFAVVIIIQMQATIEYNEYKFGERKEAVVSSMRALVAKFASAVQQGLIALTLLCTGLYYITSDISNAEYMLHDKVISQELFDLTISSKLASITSGQLVGMSVGMIIVPLLLLVAATLICAFVFKIDEKKYQEIAKALALKKNT